MADRELRHMRRTELVEIIFALKQSEDQLKAENADLTAKLEQRQIHLDSAGSIAQAALELNHVFEAAQAAADDYLASVPSNPVTVGRPGRPAGAGKSRSRPDPGTGPGRGGTAEGTDQAGM